MSRNISVSCLGVRAKGRVLFHQAVLIPNSDDVCFLAAKNKKVTLFFRSILEALEWSSRMIRAIYIMSISEYEFPDL